VIAAVGDATRCRAPVLRRCRCDGRRSTLPQWAKMPSASTNGSPRPRNQNAPHSPGRPPARPQGQQTRAVEPQPAVRVGAIYPSQPHNLHGSDEIRSAERPIRDPKLLQEHEADVGCKSSPCVPSTWEKIDRCQRKNPIASGLSTSTKWTWWTKTVKCSGSTKSSARESSKEATRRSVLEHGRATGSRHIFRCCLTRSAQRTRLPCGQQRPSHGSGRGLTYLRMISRDLSLTEASQS
jgi:hypothetical protein